jgi:Spy/CpxP family protein refolding chaperone
MEEIPPDFKPSHRLFNPACWWPHSPLAIFFRASGARHASLPVVLSFETASEGRPHMKNAYSCLLFIFHVGAGFSPHVRSEGRTYMKKEMEIIMRIWNCCLAVILFLPGSSIAESQPELGKWWKNSEIVKKLQLTETQIGLIEQKFLEHQRKLADANAQLKQNEEQLKALMRPDRPDESKVQSQIKRVAEGRAALETVYASMMLSIRKVLSKGQWKKLEEIQTVPISAAAASIPAKPLMRGSPLPEGVYAPGGRVKAPVVLYQPTPSYTQAAREARAEGLVLLEAIVRKDGTVDTI